METDVYECNHIGKSTNDILIEAGMAIKYDAAKKLINGVTDE
jgi:hypothetical protein|tara:strand:+ start:199 stop:324 length:126 start_codon:yes stop_codon:yes gene_type:complete